MRERRGVTPLKARLVALYTILVVANVAAWVWAFVLFSGDSVKLGTALLAYSLGLRHAVDADHIAAIDNVTRKLIQDEKRPLTVGFFFALGHSTIVLIAAGLIAFTVGALARLIVFNARTLNEIVSRPQADRVIIEHGARLRAEMPEYSELWEEQAKVLELAKTP